MGKIEKSSFSFAAELIAFYLESSPSAKDTHLYLLARDSELEEYALRLATEDTPLAGHIHSLNISRANMRSPHLKDYLREQGISEESLRGGKQVVFVDTGFAGTISKVVAENFPMELRDHFRTHLISSSNPSHPSSRVFLVHLNPAVNGQSRRICMVP